MFDSLENYNAIDDTYSDGSNIQEQQYTSICEFVYQNIIHMEFDIILYFVLYSILSISSIPVGFWGTDSSVSTYECYKYMISYCDLHLGWVEFIFHNHHFWICDVKLELENCVWLTKIFASNFIKTKCETTINVAHPNSGWGWQKQLSQDQKYCLCTPYIFSECHIPLRVPEEYFKKQWDETKCKTNGDS